VKYGNERHYTVLGTFHLYTVSYNKKYILWEFVRQSERNKKWKSTMRM